MGCGSASKTSHASEFALLSYWIRPEETLVILSTTTVSKLDMAIFGEIKMLWSMGREQFPGLAGNPIDYKRAITTDDIQDGGLRDLRRGIVGVACYQGRQFVGLGCFVAGTLVDTPSGKVPIEDLKKGNEIIGAFGTNRIRRCSVRSADKIVRVHFKNGSSVDCTPEHPFFTSLGWKSAIDLDANSYVLSPHETLRILSKTPDQRSPQDEILFQILQSESEREALHHVQETLYPFRCQNRDLQQGMCESMVQAAPAKCIPIKPQLSSLWQEDAKCSFQSEVLQSGMRIGQLRQDMRLVQEAIHSDRCQKRMLLQTLHDEAPHVRSTIQSKNAAKYGSGCQGSEYSEISHGTSRGNRNSKTTNEVPISAFVENTKKNGTEEFSWRPWINARRKDFECAFPRCENQLQNRYRACIETGTDSLVSNRSGMANSETGRRTGRLLSQGAKAKIEGSGQGQVSSGSWVDRVEILKREGDPRYNPDQGGYRVYNLEVEGHPSYSINNLLVHNSYAGIKQNYIIFVADELAFMPPTFLGCLPNMFQNPHVKVIGSGNPKHDRYDQLGLAAEPIGGWESLGEIKKTTVWDIRFHKGKCVNLVGTDSPNFDVADGVTPPYPRLISRETVNRVEARWKRGSLEWSKQCSGVMHIGMVGNRVLTREICDEHKAFEKAVWKDQHRTRIGFLDPAWGGVDADRCVWGWLEFGEDQHGVQIIRLNDPIVFPIMTGISIPPEDQIALAVQKESKTFNIPVENIFYDSTGKGTLGYAFARIFGSSTPVPIAFDGKASNRPVRHDLFIMDNKGIRRLKTCYEHYSKFVTELWFSVRYAVECEQIREISEATVSEFSMREYYEVAGDRIEVEPKTDTKERMGESPDLADAVSVGIEGARQRGFRIRRLGEDIEEDSNGFQWLKDRVRKHDSLIRGKQLQYA